MKENRLLKWKKIVTCLTTASFLLFNIIEPNSVKAKTSDNRKDDVETEYQIVDITEDVSNEEQKYLDKMKEKYEKLVQDNETSENFVNMSLDEFTYLMENNIGFDITDYIEKKEKKSVQENKAPANPQRSIIKGVSTFSSSSGGSSYYYDTGTKRPSKCKYKNYNLLNKVKAGDLVYEANGGYRISGHIAIVEGIFCYDLQYYVRLVEATPGYGVARGVVDDVRVDEREITIVRPATSTKIKKASVAFALSQLGKKYKLDFKKNTSAKEKDWYCSELVWAAYKNQGVDLETSLGEPGVTPRDLRDSSLTYKINFKYSTK